MRGGAITGTGSGILAIQDSFPYNASMRDGGFRCVR